MQEADRLAEILGTWLAARDRGQPIDPEVLCVAHPDLADDLRARFLAMGLVDQAFAGGRLSTPERIGEYRIVREVGRGGMGVVYEAEQTSMKRHVALKVLFPSITGSPQAVARFQREARAAGRLHHTNLVPVYGLGHEAGSWFYAMELVRGPSMAQVIERMRSGDVEEPDCSSTLTDSRGSAAQLRLLARAFAGVAEALHATHEAGVIHRDVKPSNLLVGEDGTLKLMDFGLARVEGDGPPMTVTGGMVGTPYYMSPEQAAGRRTPIDRRTDVYSLGATIYEVLTLTPPFPEEDIARLCSQILSDEPARPRSVDPRIPRDLETVVLKAMEKNRGDRYGTALELAEDLRGFADSGTIHARRVSPIGRAWRRVRRHKAVSALAAAALLATAAGAFLYVRASEESRRRIDLEYTSLCMQAEQAASLELADGDRHGEGSAVLYERAVALAPDRPEAYVSRSLRFSSLEEILANIDAAAARGASPRVVHLVRAWAYEAAQEGARAQDERRLAEAHPSEDPWAYLVEGSLCAREGDLARAITLMGRALERSPPGGTVRYIALGSRSVLHELAGDDASAIADLHAIEGTGDRGEEARLRIAAAWRRLGKEEAAKRKFDLLRRETTAESARRRLCSICGAVKQHDWLLAVANDGLEADPSSDPFLVAAAEGHMFRKEHAQAFALCERAITARPTSTLAWGVKAALLNRERKFEEALAAARRAIDVAGPSHSRHMQMAGALHGLGKYDEAIVHVRSALDIQPRNAVTWRDLSAALYSKRDYAAAVAAADRAIRIDPRSAEAHSTRGDSLLELGQRRDALEAFTRAVDLDPQNGSYHHSVGSALEELGEMDRAIAAWDRAIALGLHASRQNRGSALFRLGRFQDALEEATRMRDLDPMDPNPYSDIAAALSRLDRHEEAVAPSRRAIELDPAGLEQRLNLVEVLAHLHRWAEVRDAANAALALEKLPAAWRAEILGRKAWALSSLDDHDGAVTALRSVVELGDLSPEYHTQVAWTMAVAGEMAGALAVVDHALGAGIETARVQTLRCRLLWEHGRHAEALGAVQRALELDPKDEEAIRNFGLALAAVGKEAEAAAAFEGAIQGLPDDPVAMGNLAWFLATCGDPTLRDPKRSVRLARKAVLTPSPRAWNAMGMALYRVGSWAESLEALEKAVAMDPATTAFDDLPLAMAHHQLGHLDEARAHFEKALEWMRSAKGNHPTLLRLRDEAADLLQPR